MGDAVVAVLMVLGLAVWSAVTLGWAHLMQKAGFSLAERAAADREEAAATWAKVKRRTAEWREAMALHEYGAHAEAREIANRWDREDAGA